MNKKEKNSSELFIENCLDTDPDIILSALLESLSEDKISEDIPVDGERATNPQAEKDEKENNSITEPAVVSSENPKLDKQPPPKMDDKNKSELSNSPVANPQAEKAEKEQNFQLTEETIGAIFDVFGNIENCLFLEDIQDTDQLEKAKSVMLAISKNGTTQQDLNNALDTSVLEVIRQNNDVYNSFKNISFLFELGKISGMELLAYFSIGLKLPITDRIKKLLTSNAFKTTSTQRVPLVLKSDINDIIDDKYFKSRVSCINEIIKYYSKTKLSDCLQDIIKIADIKKNTEIKEIQELQSKIQQVNIGDTLSQLGSAGVGILLSLTASGIGLPLSILGVALSSAGLIGSGIRNIIQKYNNNRYIREARTKIALYQDNYFRTADKFQNVFSLQLNKSSEDALKYIQDNFSNIKISDREQILKDAAESKELRDFYNKINNNFLHEEFQTIYKYLNTGEQND